ncbi:16S rRNA (cytidine(1402)-2'-O)-methyltransferase [bacterium]|jgi:16S rRNA (cytidine1402-2'-O)-methyltransferase|nr:16S rRNA (cytidine(1402)-2'-O)-methyltransferase [bacterium]MBT4251196.1 16S rRNA (cytidine(1402)-2'-O)-methyltransferase [bacterium]MBT4598012.1 16S rRNA (cytidine(1402)-2'-O)-methyltransferase [bacterium]MBT6753575.1 16S rRNA (cytidine(1402)-2'-O)-methyltransferase [bacterium]MBT7037690.1 16S rRNA (cytidine(1402)-2'-O)-methyltransferase [bacterium]
MEKAKIYIIGTPIGNLSDVTFRAIETLSEVDLILCEDTRVTARLLNRYEIKKPLLSYHQQSGLSKVDKIIDLLREGKKLALVTDAGTPGISDPGNELVAKILEEFKEDVCVIPIPGVSAITALASVAGIDLSKFVFLGFIPNKKGRQTFLKKAINACFPVLYYDSPYRFMKNLKLCKELCEELGVHKRMIVGRELTKIFEEIVRGDLDEIEEYFLSKDGKIKGEFVVILY